VNQDLVQLLGARARGKCECCGQPFGFGFAAPTVDHMFGRAKAEEIEFNCWVLRGDHHAAKTDNKPSAIHWLLKFIAHCGRYRHGENGYATAALAAQKKLEWMQTKATLATGNA
jgi:hypothetical protein